MYTEETVFMKPAVVEFLSAVQFTVGLQDHYLSNILCISRKGFGSAVLYRWLDR